AGLAEAEDALASNEFVMGSHHLSLAVYADDLKQLGDRGARARARLTDAGSVVCRKASGWRRPSGRSCPETSSGVPGRVPSTHATSPGFRVWTIFRQARRRAIGDRRLPGSAPMA